MYVVTETMNTHFSAELRIGNQLEKSWSIMGASKRRGRNFSRKVHRAIGA